MTKFTTLWDLSRRDLIDLAIEYGMVGSVQAFEEFNARRQDAILRTMGKLADAMDWTGCFEPAA